MGRIREKIALLLFITAYFQNGCCEGTLRLPQDEPEMSLQEDAQVSNDVSKKQNIVTIDLNQCTCTAVSSCDLTILKSPLMDISCGEEESLCCPMKKSESSQPPEQSNEEPAEVAPRSNIRVYSISPTIIKDFNSSADTSFSRNSLKNKNRKCACKARSSCPHKYIDYGFGFYCTYNTVRCCIPEETVTEEATITSLDSEKVEETSAPMSNITAPETSNPESATAENDVESMQVAPDMTVSEMNSTEVANITDIALDTIEMTEIENNAFNTSILGVDSENNMTASFIEEVASGDDEVVEKTPVEPEGGELIITEVTDWSGLEDGDEDYQKEAECFCLPIQKCQVGGSYNEASNMIERRRDTLCPSDLVQCCGRDVMDEITKKRDDVAGEYDVTAQMKSDTPEASPEQINQYTTTSDTFPLTNHTELGAVPTAFKEASNSPSPSVLEAPFPGYQPPGFYKGYGSNNQYSANSYPSSQRTTTNQYYNNGPQQQQPHPQNQYDATGGQSYTPWLYSNKYAPQLVNGQPHTGGYQPRYPYATGGEAPRHKTGGLFDTLSKFLG